MDQLPWPLYTILHDDPHSPDVLTRQPSLSSLLQHYDGSAPPPSARVHPHVQTNNSTSFGLWNMVKFGVVAASKAKEIAGDVLSHTIWGPRKKSWGIEMTLLSSIMRDMGRHSSLVDLYTIRTIMGLTGYIPLPSDALVTPFTFRVRKRNLRGVLSDLDSKEDGTRELSGEWVVGKKIWQRLQGEWKAAKGSKAQTPGGHKEDGERVIFYLHGGAYYISSAAAQRLVSIPLSKYTEYRVFALDYRLAPETNFPGPLHDAVSGFFRLTVDLRIPPQNIILAGDSAGGGLCLALMMYLRDNKYPLPSAAILMSPWVDLTMSCDSWESNAMYDVVPVVSADDPLNPVGLYLGEGMHKYLTHPYASPLFGDLSGLPPLLIQSGDSEVLRDEITLLAHKAKISGTEVQHELYEDAIHVFQSFPFLDQSRRAFVSMRDYVQNVLPQIQAGTPQPLDSSAEEEMAHEIDNEKVKVVRGDGVETGSGRKRASESVSDLTKDAPKSPRFLQRKYTDESDVSESDDDDEFPSWARATPSRTPSRKPSWSGPIISDSDVTSGGPITPADEISPPILRRIQSATHALLGDDPAKHVRHTRRHKRSSTVSENKAFSDRITIPTLTMSSIVTQPHTFSPSIRRTKTNTSHPDISSLVNHFNSSGPAHETTVYRPRVKSRQPTSYFNL